MVTGPPPGDPAGAIQRTTDAEAEAVTDTLNQELR